MSIALRAFYALVIALLLAPLPANAQDAKIGVTAVVNPNATGQPPSQARRTLLIGSSVFSQENVITTENGQAQMLFLDESALTIGPNSEVVLDEFVYDPNTKTGKLALTATKGLFRLVGGRISKTNPVILKTPTATIGIRGGIAMVNASDVGGATTSTFLFGDQMDVTSGGVTKSATRPGFTITVTNANVPPSDPVPAIAAQLSGALSSLEGSSEPASDSENAPTDDNVAAAGVSGGSESAPSAVAPPEPAKTVAEIAAEVEEVAGIVIDSEGEEEKKENSTEIATEPGASTGGGLSGLTGLVGRFKHSTSITQGSDDGTGGNFNSPFSNANVSGGTFTVVLPSSNSLTFPVQAASLGPLSFTAASGATGPLNGSSGLAGTSTVFSGNQFVVLEAAEITTPTHLVFAFAGTPTASFPTTGATFYGFRRDFQLDSNVPFVLKASGGDILPDPALSTAAEAFAAIYWDTSGASTAQRVFGFATGGVSGTGTSQKSVGSLIIGNVVTATLDGVTRTFIDAAMVGSSRTSSGLLPHFIDGEASTAFGGGSSFGQDIFFFGDNAGFFVMEGVEINNSGVKINVGTEKIEDTFGTVASATEYSPNTVFSPATDTLEARTTRNMNGYVGGLFERVLSDGSQDTTTGGQRIFLDTW